MITEVRLQTKRKVVTSPLSDYKPGEDVAFASREMVKKFRRCLTAKQKAYRELNDYSPIERQSIDQRRFNGFQEDFSSSPDDAWRSNAVKPITRNRVVSVAAHMTASPIIPIIEAQNDNDDADHAASSVMRDLIEWTMDNSRPMWSKTFFYLVLAALVNPAAFLHTEYSITKRIVLNDDGSEKEIIDDEYSGFQDTIVPLDEIYFPDFYEENIQKQPYIFWRRVITWEAAETKYGHQDNWKYVKKGMQIILPEEGEYFYEVYDKQLADGLVEEIIMWDRNQSTRTRWVNGVIMGTPKDPNPRQDKKYPFIKCGYEPVDEGKFALYKSLVFKMGPDEENIQVLYRMLFDASALALSPPMLTFGDEAVGSNIMAPGMSTSLAGDAKVTALAPGSNMQAGINMLNIVEKSMNETSVDPMMSGIGAPGNKTAEQISFLQQNSLVTMGLFKQMLGFAVYDFTKLRIGDVLQYMTVGDVMETGSEATVLKFKSFVLSNKIIDGKKKSRKITFNPDIFGKEEVTQADYEKKSFELLARGGDNVELVEANPDLMEKMKYLVRVTPEIMSPRSQDTNKALNLELYDRAIANPLADQAAIYKDFLLGNYDVSKGDPDKYVAKQPPIQQGLLGASGGQAPGNSAVAMLTNQRQQESTAQLIKR